jgi:hypothetical protein
MHVERASNPATTEEEEDALECIGNHVRALDEILGV